jgi:hypothetical protein
VKYCEGSKRPKFKQMSLLTSSATKLHPQSICHSQRRPFSLFQAGLCVLGRDKEKRIFRTPHFALSNPDLISQETSRPRVKRGRSDTVGLRKRQSAFGLNRPMKAAYCRSDRMNVAEINHSARSGVGSRGVKVSNTMVNAK